MLSVLQLGVIIIHLPFTEVAACSRRFLTNLESRGVLWGCV